MFADGSEWELADSGDSLCDSCGIEPGTVHIIRVEDGEFVHTHLCQTCAEEAAGGTEASEIFFAVPTAVAGLLRSLLSTGARRRPVGEAGLMCGVCGSTLADVEERGLLGCPACYEAFAEHITAALVQTEAGMHLGKEPGAPAGQVSTKREVLRLERMLAELVGDERFEEAAGVRDRLAELSARMSREGDH
ncbi:MAG: UvrB/UvrC motif-containing protein [Thermoleophilia bacterium]